MMQDATLIVPAKAVTKKTLFDKLIQILFRQGVIDSQNKPLCWHRDCSYVCRREGTGVAVFVTSDVLLVSIGALYL